MDNMVQTLRRRKFIVDQLQVYWMIPDYPRCASFPAASNEEIDISLLSRDVWSMVHEEGTKPAAGEKLQRR